MPQMMVFYQGTPIGSAQVILKPGAWQPRHEHLVCPNCGEEWGGLFFLELPDLRHRWNEEFCEKCWNLPQVQPWGGVSKRPPVFSHPDRDRCFDFIDRWIVKWPREVLARDFLYLCELSDEP